MPRALELLLPLFEQAWGPSLAELCAPAAQDAAQRADAGARPGAQQALAGEALVHAPELAPAITAALLNWLWTRNQFFAIDGAGQRELARSVDGVLAAWRRGGELDPALARHRRELATFVRTRLGPAPRDVVAAQYSPQLQLEVLGLVDEPLSEPILDIGCGAEAALVRTLRARGLAAEGLDRLAPAEVGRAGDWLDHDYGTARWGTVLSHLGFTLHFLHHHLAQGDGAYAYARTYMAILRSVRPGGRFVYAPAVPFFEALLDPAQHRVVRKPLPERLRVPSLVELEAQTGLALGGAVHVLCVRES